MPRTSNLGSPLRVLAFGAASVFGLATAGQAFTLIPLNTVEKMSTGVPAPADGDSDTTSKPRYTVSDDGCFAVFTSTAKNLASGQSDGNGETDVFLYESCGTYKVTLVSHVATDRDKAATGRSDQPVISPDGAFVVFRSTAPDIVEGTGYGVQTNVFLWDRVADTFALVSHGTLAPNQAGNGDSLNGVISRSQAAGRRFVAFESVASNLVASDDNGASDVFRFDSSDKQIILVSVPNEDPRADRGSFNPAINGDGACIVYESEATNLVSTKPTDDANDARDVFRWEFAAEPFATILLSHRAGAPSFGVGAETGDGESTEASIDDDCAAFAFKSFASNLAVNQNDTKGETDVFTARNGGDAVLVSHAASDPDLAGSDRSDSPILSRDGKWVAYASLAEDVAGQADTGAPSYDVFVYSIADGKSKLVSHTVGDPDKVAGGESFAPEISIDGFYVAYESDAKDLDPNQNEGNGARDVFLYNTRWNNSIVASPRYASIAITGNGRSHRPALSGRGYAVAFTGLSTNHIADDLEIGAVDDAFLFKATEFLSFMSVRSTNGTNTLEWIMPPVDYVTMEAYVTPGTCTGSGYPGATQLLAAPPPANASALFTDPATYGSATSLCYSIFIERDGAGPLTTGESPAHEINVRTVEDATGAVKWASNLSEFSTLAQVGIGTQNLIAVANEGGVYGLTRGPAGGFWPSTYRPFRTTFSPIQGRPPILSLPVMGSTRTAFVGSQDGRAYAFDADRGARVGGALWYTSPALGTEVQSGVAGMFTMFGGLGDHLLVGTRNGAAPAEFFALDPSTGLRVGLPFSGGGLIGAINTSAAVDYTLGQVYFASLELTGAAPSLWCLKLTAGGLGATCWPPRTVPAGISGGPVQRNGRVYAGDDSGLVWAFDAVSGNLVWPGPYTSCPGGGGVKSYVLADRQGTAQDLYYAKSGGLCAVTDQGALSATKWSIGSATIPDPSAPILARILGVAYIYVGSSNGRLYQIEANNPGAITSVLLRTGATIGPPAFDVFDNMVYAGSDAGAIYAVQAPF